LIWYTTVKCSGRHISTLFFVGVRPLAAGIARVPVSAVVSVWVSVTVDISLLRRYS
jgi:hypothetical protein